MKLAKQAVGYFSAVTGQEWFVFYDRLDEAMAGDIKTQTGELWLIHKLMDTIISNGMSLNEFKINKDAIKAEFDEEGRKKNGEFFTPEVWCKEGRSLFDKYIPNWQNFNVWDGSCYSMDTEVLTQRGWVLYDDLRDNDKIYTLNPVTLQGEWSGFHNRFKKPYKGDMVHFENKGIDLLVTADHQMFCLRRTSSKKPRVGVSLDALSIYNTLSKHNGSHSNTFKVVVSAKSVENYMYDSVLASGVLGHIKDWNSFWYLVGQFTARGNYSNNDLKFFYKNNSRVTYSVRNALDSLGFKYYCEYSGLNDKLIFRVTDVWLIDFLRTYVGLGSKSRRIPFNLVRVDYLESLFDGLFDRDSDSYERDKNCRYWTVNKDLISDIELLCILVGRTSKLSERRRKPKEPIEYNLYISGKSEKGIRNDGVSLESYDGYVWDLTTDNDNHIFYVRRNGKVAFSKNCGSGNLMRSAKHSGEKMFLSSLQETDIQTIKSTQEYEGATAFQLDFLDSVDYDEYNTNFLDKLPPRLQEIIRNDEPLIIYMNPPYKTGMAKSTEVGRHMIDNAFTQERTFEETGERTFSKPAYDIFYQFCWQVMNLVDIFDLKNTYYCFFGPLTFFTGAGAGILLKEFEYRFEFIDGMCISAQEFSDTSDSILWGIGCSLWKSRGAVGNLGDKVFHKDILLEKKYLLPDGGVSSEGRVLYEPPREKLSTWVVPKDVSFYDEMPLMTSHLTFKGGDVFEKTAYKKAKLAKNALGTLMVGNTLTRSADQSAVMSMPSTIQYVSITEENFWRCVASYAFRRVYDASWAVAKKEISAPNTNVEGYDLWLKNALVLFLFEYKSMMSSLRGVQYADGGESITIRNNLFYLSEEEVRQHCHDEVILKDLEENPPTNQFMLEKIKECEPYWSPEIRALFNWCKAYTLATYDSRVKVDYKGSLECWDAGFQQLRAGLWDEERLGEDLTRLLVDARDYMKKNLDSFGFVSEVEDEK